MRLTTHHQWLSIPKQPTSVHLRNFSSTPSLKKIGSRKKPVEAQENKSANLQLSQQIQPPPASAAATVTAFANYTHLNRSPGQELDQLQVLVNRLHTTNSPVSKRAILTQHPDQAPLLSWIYNPLKQFHVRSSHILKYAQRRARLQDEAMAFEAEASGRLTRGTTSNISGQDFDTLSSLLVALSTRAITGHNSLDAILLFMTRFCSPPAATTTKATSSNSPQKTPFSQQSKELFATARSKLLFKILDKNLKTGCSIGLIRAVYPGLIPEFHVSLAKQLFHLTDAQSLCFPEPILKSQKVSKKNKEASRKTKKKRKSDTMDEVEAGEGIAEIVNGVDSKQCTPIMTPWYGSRKLDGVRCLIRVDKETGAIETFSRTGRVFENLGTVVEALQTLVGRDNVPRETFFRKAFDSVNISSDNDNRGRDLPDAMILDGEICVFAVPVPSPKTEKTSLYRREPELLDDLGRENFLKTVSIARRAMLTTEDSNNDNNRAHEQSKGDNEDFDKHELTMEDGLVGQFSDRGDGLAANERLMYCAFDCLTDREFEQRESTRTFSTRIQGLLSALSIESNGANASTTAVPEVTRARECIRVLNQTKLENFEHLERLVGLSIERGWEGVMLRKDVGYEGKRTRNLLKVKQFRDAEFKVQDVTVGRMRIAIQGEFKERDNVLTSVTILHRGNRVGVGSGFSAEERIRYGRDPTLIIGKTVTVKYFEESKTTSGSGSTLPGKSNPDDTVWSLRFPTIKAIYHAGSRQV
ncbi:hypothetical protein BG004_000872 [Podila humilis]|nr:hypothetical protein BG004_000872 [Podila humilis]